MSHFLYHDNGAINLDQVRRFSTTDNGLGEYYVTFYFANGYSDVMWTWKNPMDRASALQMIGGAYV